MNIPANDETIVSKRCPGCGKIHPLTVKTSALKAWRDGQLIQDAFPEMSKDDREILMTGTRPSCWDEMWKEEDEQEGPE